MGSKRKPAVIHVYHDATELPSPVKQWYLPAPDGHGEVKVSRLDHHASQFVADKYDFVKIDTTACGEFLTQKIVREYAVWLFHVQDKTYGTFQDGKPYNMAAQMIMMRHVEKSKYVGQYGCKFDAGRWYQEVYAKEAVLSTLRYQDDFIELQTQMVKAFGLQNLVGVVSLHYVAYDLNERMKAEKDNAAYIPMLRLLGNMLGWIKYCQHCGETVDCKTELN